MQPTASTVGATGGPGGSQGTFRNSDFARAARDLQVFGDIAGEDPAAKAVFLPTGSTPPGEGQSLQQNDLANVLGQLRQRGAGAFYTGQLGEKIAAGLGIDARKLSGYQAQWRETADVKHGNDVMHFASVPEGLPPPKRCGTLLPHRPAGAMPA